jgi:hypothetical protein
VIGPVQVIERLPFTTTGWAIPVASIRDGHIFYAHVVLPPFFKLLNQEQQNAVCRTAQEKARAALDAMVRGVFGPAPAA